MFARALFVFAVLASPAFASDPSAIDFARQQAVETAQRLWSSASQPTWGPAAALRGIVELMRPLRTLQQPVISDVPRLMSYAWARVEDKSIGIHNMYATFLNFLDGTFRKYEVTRDDSLPPMVMRTARDFADGMIADVDLLPEIHRRMFANETVYGELVKVTDQATCNSFLSQQMQLYDIYVASQLTFLKGYAMAQAGWLIYDALGLKSSRGGYWNNANNLTDAYQDLSRKQAALAKQYMEDAKRDFMLCDPDVFKQHSNYEKVIGLLQGFVENEAHMNADDSCRGSCKNYQVGVVHSCTPNQFCADRPQCSGRLLYCKFVESDMKICVPKSFQSDRQYEYISYKKGTLLGTARANEECNLVTVNSWWRFFLPAHCSYCFCLCEKNLSESERYFSLGSSMADTENNKVVTGVRLIKIKRTFYLQVQQGELLPHGTVNQTTLEWVPVDQKAPTFLMSYENRYMDLDDIKAPEGYLMTGMRFRTIGSHLNTEIMVSPFDFDKGLLHRADVLSYWHGNDNTEHSPAPNTRTMLTLSTTDVIFDQKANTPKSTTNSFVQFRESSMETDASQNTIPFIDIRPVSPSPATILTGAGLYLRGSSIMAGFVAPRLITYDISPHIDGESQVRDNKTAL